MDEAPFNDLFTGSPFEKRIGLYRSLLANQELTHENRLAQCDAQYPIPEEGFISERRDSDLSRKNSQSGIRGISYVAKRNRWDATLVYKGKKWRKQFDTRQEAIEAITAERARLGIST